MRVGHRPLLPSCRAPRRPTSVPVAFRLPRSNTSRARGHSCEAWPGHTPGSGICTAAEVWVAWCGVNYMYKNGKSSKRYSDESDEVYSRFLLAVAQDGLHRVTPGDQTHRLSELLYNFTTTSRCVTSLSLTMSVCKRDFSRPKQDKTRCLFGMSVCAHINRTRYWE